MRAPDGRAWLLIAFAVWALLCVCVLVISTGNSDLPRSGESDLVLIYGMAVLGFPSTAALVVVEGELMKRLYECCGLAYGTGDMTRVIRWALYFGVGSLQWLVWARLFLRWHRKRATAVAAASS